MTTAAPLLVTFENRNLKLVSHDDERLMTIRELALGLGSKIRSLKKLVQKLKEKGELKEGVHFRCIPFQTCGGVQTTTLLTYRGIIRILMRSDSPRAARFRDWAEEVLYSIMTDPGYDLQGLRSLVEPGLKSIGTAANEAVEQVCDLIVTLRSVNTTNLSNQGQTRRTRGPHITAISWVRTYYPTYYYSAMNFGGKFESFVSRRFLKVHGRWPEHLETHRLHAWAYSEQRDKRFLERCLAAFYRQEFLHKFPTHLTLPQNNDVEEV